GIATVKAKTVSFTGNYTGGGGSTVSGSINVGVAPAADPLASLPAPDPSTMNLYSGVNMSRGGKTLQPGVYVGGISMSGGSRTLWPGIYYMQGGGITMTGASSITGSGVMIYNDGGGAIKLAGSGAVTLSPPSSGTYAGLCLYQNRTSTTGVTLTGLAQF